MGSKSVVDSPNATATLVRVAEALVDPDPVRIRFRHRNLSERAIDALVASGVEAPERLLFMSPLEIFRIPGIGRVAPQRSRATVRCLARWSSIPEAAGVEFTNGEQPGVRLRKSTDSNLRPPA
jgi:hypothetical protein